MTGEKRSREPITYGVAVVLVARVRSGGIYWRLIEQEFKQDMSEYGSECVLADEVEVGCVLVVFSCETFRVSFRFVSFQGG